MIGTAAAGGIYAAPTSKPIIFILVYGRGRGMPRPYTRNRGRPSWPPLRGGSARRRWGREPCGGQEYFGPRLAKNLIGLLRPYGWFVGDAYMRPVRVTRYTALSGRLRRAAYMPPLQANPLYSFWYMVAGGACPAPTHAIGPWPPLRGKFLTCRGEHCSPANL